MSDAPRDNARPATFLALGDSYTIGEGVAPEERWPSQLVRRLRAGGVAIADPTIVARTGWTTVDLLAALDDADLSPPYDLVTLLIGVNDQYRGRDVREYRHDFERLLNYAIGLAASSPSRVVVISIPDWGVTPFAAGRDAAMIAADIDRFNRANSEAALRARTAYVDITGLTRRSGSDDLTGDGLHPSGRMYREWLGVLERPAKQLLESRVSPSR